MATVDYWAEKFLQKSKNAVLDSNSENLDALKRWYATLENFDSEFTNYDLLKQLKKSPDCIFAVIAYGLLSEPDYAGMLWGLTHGTNNPISRDSVFESIDSFGLTPAIKIQILSKVSGENSPDLDTKIGSEVTEYLERQPECPDSELIAMIRYLQFAKDSRFLGRSIGFYSHRDWRRRMRTYLFAKHGSLDDVIQLAGTFFAEGVLQTALTEFKARNGDSAALDQILQTRRVTRSKSNVLHQATDSELAALCKDAYEKGAYTDTSAQFLTEIQGLYLPDEIIFGMIANNQRDVSLRETLVHLLSRRNKYGYVVNKLRDVPLHEMSEIELSDLQLAARNIGDTEVSLKIHAYKPIDDWQFLARLSGDLANMGRWDESEVIYNYSIRDLDPTQLHKSKSIRNKQLDGEGLLLFAEHYPVDWPEGLLNLAKHIWVTTEDYDKAKELLLKGFDLGNSKCAEFLVQISWGKNLEEKYYIAGSEKRNAYASKREYAKYLYNQGRRDEAIIQAEEAALDDDEAAHFLIHVLGHNVPRWANYLNDKDLEFTADVFRDQFESSGLPMLPKSELETIELHNLEKAIGLGYSKRQIQNGKVVIEKWFCRRAFADSAETATWGSASCKFHKEDTAEFEEIRFINPLNDPQWNQERAIYAENSRPFQLEGHPRLEKAFQRRGFRDWQREAYENWVKHGRRGIIEAATGSGKSLIGVMAALEALDEGFAVVIVAPTRVLQQQWISQYFLALWDSPNKPIRTIGNEGALYDRPTRTIAPGTITVAVWKSLRDHPEYNPRDGVKSLIIADEVHNYSSKVSENMLDEGYTRRLGLTATLQPPQGRYGALTNFFGGHPLYVYDFGRAVTDKVISAYNLLLILVPLDSRVKALYTAAYEEMNRQKEWLIKVANIPSRPDLFYTELTKLKSRNKHIDIIEAYERAFAESDEYLKESASKAGAVRLIADFVKKRGNTIVFSDSFDNARNVQAILESRGVHGQVVNKDVSQPERERIFEELRRKNVKVILSPKALDEGVDISELSTGVFSGTSRRRLQIVQRMGRVLRIAPGKEFPLIVMMAAEGTEEDPRMPNNSQLDFSPFGVVYERATTVGVAHITEEEKIKSLLVEFS
jgi:superfamily II DNA or RNA helicase